LDQIGVVVFKLVMWSYGAISWWPVWFLQVTLSRWKSENLCCVGSGHPAAYNLKEPICLLKRSRLPILDTEHWARSWSRCTGSQPAGDRKSSTRR